LEQIRQGQYRKMFIESPIEGYKHIYLSRDSFVKLNFSAVIALYKYSY